MANVRLENITKRFDEVIAVNDLSLDVQDKEFMVLLGPSGCGKTTTLRCIAGLEQPDKGDIYIDEVRVNDFTPADRDIAFVFQFYALYPHMTVYGNLAFPLRAVHMPKAGIAERAREVAGILRISHLLSRRPDKLSGGEMQRVALGRAMVRRPKVFLMDEPLTNLDAKLRAEMRAELKRLQSDLGATTVYVTHDQLEAMSMGDRIVVMNEGKIQQLGTPMEVYDHPANLFVAGFIGSPRMNLVDCEYADRAGQGFLKTTDGTFIMNVSSEIAHHIRTKSSGQQLVLGVRPEDIFVYREPAPERLAAEVYVVEPLGSENIVDLQFGQHLLKAKTLPTFQAKIGEPLWIELARERIHIFDKVTELAII